MDLCTIYQLGVCKCSAITAERSCLHEETQTQEASFKSTGAERTICMAKDAGFLSSIE